MKQEVGVEAPKHSFDKDRVFRYYNEIHYETYEDSQVYGDSKKFVDFREVTKEYLEHSFLGAKKFIPPQGKYFLDVASGPIGLKEYLALSEGYEYRICMDISYNALLQAKHNLKGQKGIFICGDITNIPLQDEVCDIALSQHTIYHVPKNEQESAVRELYRVTRTGGKTIIVYNWFYHSWLMNLSLFPVQAYRVIRHYLGKLYVRFFPGRPRLYFYAHSPAWFRRLGYGDKLQIYCWRSLNREFMKLYIHKGLFGRQILAFIQRVEQKYPKLMGILGDYPVIVIEK